MFSQMNVKYGMILNGWIIYNYNMWPYLSPNTVHLH